MGHTIANPEFDWASISTLQKGANDRIVTQQQGNCPSGTSLVRISPFIRDIRSSAYLKIQNTFLGMFRPFRH